MKRNDLIAQLRRNEVALAKTEAKLRREMDKLALMLKLWGSPEFDKMFRKEGQ